MAQEFLWIHCRGRTQREGSLARGSKKINFDGFEELEDTEALDEGRNCFRNLRRTQAVGLGFDDCEDRNFRALRDPAHVCADSLQIDSNCHVWVRHRIVIESGFSADVQCC